MLYACPMVHCFDGMVFVENPDLFEKLQASFYADHVDVMLKALRVE